MEYDIGHGWILVRPKGETMEDRTNVIKIICEALSSGDTSGASEIAWRHYPFIAPPAVARKFTEAQALRVFVRDGFVDRYSGNRLLFPPVLRLLSILLPGVFPFHRNWKMSETHPAYWELFPTLDHIIPVARGGPDQEDNLISTSMLRNSTKANWTLEELGWSIHPPGDMNQWDGMLVRCIKKDSEIIKDKYISRWYRAADLCHRHPGGNGELFCEHALRK